MKILWVNPNFLHPTTKGGQIRTLEMLRRICHRHEVHYVAFENPAEPDGLARSGEYASRAYPFRHRIPAKDSPAFFLELLTGLFSPLPVAVNRYHSPQMSAFLSQLIRKERFDTVVCDFLASAPNFRALDNVVLFQHNVETMIWRRHAATVRDPFRKLYFTLQARRMFRYERHVCNSASFVIAVSPVDVESMRALFGVSRIADIPTGVDIEYFSPPPQSAPVADLVFVGSMDWLPNIDGVHYFLEEVLPLIRSRRPSCRVAVVGRTPSADIVARAQSDPLVTVTGTVPDIRPFFWGSRVCIVPLRIGGGTRLKIYESMAARTPVVSTSIGAEGLAVEHGKHILLADSAECFASCCLDLLDNASLHSRLSNEAWRLVASSFSWDQVVTRFEAILESIATRV